MANWDPQLVTPTLATAPNLGSGIMGSSGAGVQQHHGVVGLVILAAAVLFLLDRAGFRFAVTAGRR